MKGLIELSNLAVVIVKAKCNTSSKTKNIVKVKMNTQIFLIEFFKMKPPYNLNLMCNKVVELEQLYHCT